MSQPTRRSDRQRGLSATRAWERADELVPEMVKLIKAEYPRASKRLKATLVLRDMGYDVVEIAEVLGVCYLTVYRELWGAGDHRDE